MGCGAVLFWAPTFDIGTFGSFTANQISDLPSLLVNFVSSARMRNKLYLAQWRSLRFIHSSTIGDKKASTSKPTSICEFANFLLAASITKTLSISGVCDLNADLITLSESLVLQVLKKNSLDASKKIEFFRWCSQRPTYKHTAATYSQIFRVLSDSRNRAYLLNLNAPNLLTSMIKEDVRVDSGTFKLLLDAYILSGQFDSALEILDRMEELGVSLNPQIYNSVLVALIRKGQLSIALSMFSQLFDTSSGNGAVMPCEAVACNELLVALRRAGMKKEFKEVFYKLKEKKYVFDIYGYNICIHSFGCWGDLNTALQLFNEMKNPTGISSSCCPDLCTYNSLIHVLCLVGKVKDALTVYEELRGSGHEPDAFTYRIIIQGCSKAFQLDNAIRIFNEMQYNGFQPDTIVYNSVLDGLFKARRVKEACQFFEKMTQDGTRASCWTYNIVIDGLIKNGRVIAAYTLFTDLKKKGTFVDGVTYSLIVLHLCREGQILEALQLVEEMEARGFVVDLVTITSLVVGLYKQGRWDAVERLIKHIRDGNLLASVLKWKADMEALLRDPRGTKKDFTPLFQSKGILIEMITKITSKSDDQLKSDVAKHLDVGIQSHFIDEWSSSPYMDQLANQTQSKSHMFSWFSLFRGKRVQAEGMSSFDTDMVNTYLSIFLAKGKLSLACKLFERFSDIGLDVTGYTYNSIASSFVKKGYINEAWGVLHEMGQFCPADVATYNMIIQSLGKMGRADLASSILDRLMEDGGYLDIVMYNTLISALGKSGRVDEVNQLFQQMKNSGVYPDIVTFNTLIEVHTKAGRLKEAYKFLRMMLDAGCSPNHVTDTTLDVLAREIEKLRLQKASMRRNYDGTSN